MLTLHALSLVITALQSDEQSLLPSVLHAASPSISLELFSFLRVAAV